jgi:hypothetical protein
VSACVLSHVNTSGQHIGLWLDSADPALGWGQSTSYPYQEGSFFGNIFVSPPQAFYCNGKDWDQGLVPGRLGVGQNGAPYKNPASSTYCKDYCATADGSASGDGYKSCGNYKHVITVWRNFDPATQYKVCSRNGGKCLDVQGASTSNGATVVEYGYKASDNQKRMTSQVSPRNYKFINVASGKALDISGGWTGNGAALIQYDYHAGANQLWNFTPTGDGYHKFSPGSNDNGSIAVPSGTPADGVAVQQWSWTGAVNQQWVITPAS